jgi:murein L,D-transpeptidase YafK
MKRFPYFVALLLFSAFFSCGRFGGPKEGRDVAAHEKTFPALKSGLADKGIDIGKVEIFLRAFKQEKELQVWARERGVDTFAYFKSYPFCKLSGDPGPKRNEGDYQVPEGGYHIDRFNPQSSFHLSLGLNYPNASDRILGDPERPGSDIFIHGACVTVGCIPITNAKIKELYTLADIARKGGQQRIQAHLLPFEMTEKKLSAQVSKHPTHQNFWENIRPLYSYFEQHKRLPSFSINEQGEYVFK